MSRGHVFTGNGNGGDGSNGGPRDWCADCQKGTCELHRRSEFPPAVCGCGRPTCRGECRWPTAECQARVCGCGCGDRRPCGPKCPPRCKRRTCADCTRCGQVEQKCECRRPKLCAGTLVPLDRCDFRCTLPRCEWRPRPCRCGREKCGGECNNRGGGREPCGGKCGREKCGGGCGERNEGGGGGGGGGCNECGEQKCRCKEVRKCGPKCPTDRCGAACGGNGLSTEQYEDAIDPRQLDLFRSGQPVTVAADALLAWRIDERTMRSRNSAIPAAFSEIDLLGRTAARAFVFRARPASIFRNPTAMHLLRLLALTLWRLDGLLPLPWRSSRYSRIYQFCVHKHVQWWVRIRRARTGVLFPELPSRQLRFNTYQETLSQLALQRRALRCVYVALPIGLAFFPSEACRLDGQRSSPMGERSSPMGQRSSPTGDPLRCWAPITKRVPDSEATYVYIQRLQRSTTASLAVVEPPFLGPIGAYPTDAERALALETVYGRAREIARCLYAQDIQIDFHAPDALVVDCNFRVWATALRRLQIGYRILGSIDPYLAVVDSYVEFGPGLGVNGVYEGDRITQGPGALLDESALAYDAAGFDFSTDFPLDSADAAALQLTETTAGQLVNGGGGGGAVADVPGGFPPNGGDSGVLPSVAAAISTPLGDGAGGLGGGSGVAGLGGGGLGGGLRGGAALAASGAATNPLGTSSLGGVASRQPGIGGAAAYRTTGDGGAAAYRAMAFRGAGRR